MARYCGSMVEQRIRNAQVVSSILTSSSNEAGGKVRSLSRLFFHVLRCFDMIQEAAAHRLWSISVALLSAPRRRRSLTAVVFPNCKLPARGSFVLYAGFAKTVFLMQACILPSIMV